MATKEKPPLTDKQKQEKFLKWMKDEKSGAEGSACGSDSSCNHAYSAAMTKVCNKARKIFVKPKKDKE